MTLHKPLDRLLNDICFDLAIHNNRLGHVICDGPAFHLGQHPQPPLRMRQRIVAGIRNALDRDVRSCFLGRNRFAQLRDRWMGKHFAYSNLNAKLPMNSTYHLGRFQTVASEIEETIPNADPLDTEDFRPRSGK